MRAVVVGSVESSRVAIEAISAAGSWQLPLVVTLPVDLAHRHSDYVDLAPSASAAGAAILTTANSNAPEVCRAVKDVAPDYVFVVGWSQICRDDFMTAAQGKVIGYHPAPLPHMRGRAVIPWTILAGEAITGGTLFWIDAGVDSGPILSQRFMHVAPDETAETLYQRHMMLLGGLMTEALASLESDTPRRDVQDERFATWVARRTVESGRIIWDAPACDIERLVRATGRPYPGARTRVGSRNDDLIIWKANVAAEGGRHFARPGQIVARSDNSFTVYCGDRTTIEVTEWEASSWSPVMHAQLGSAS